MSFVTLNVPSSLAKGATITAVGKIKNTQALPGNFTVHLEFLSDRIHIGTNPISLSPGQEADFACTVTPPNFLNIMPNHDIYGRAYVWLVPTGETESRDVTILLYSPPPPPSGKGTLLVDTTPVKGEVYVDGVSWGTAPQSRSLDPGGCTVTFGEVAGYAKPQAQTATVVEGQITTVTGAYTLIAAKKPSKVLGGIILFGATVMAIGFLLTRK